MVVEQSKDIGRIHQEKFCLGFCILETTKQFKQGSDLSVLVSDISVGGVWDGWIMKGKEQIGLGRIWRFVKDDKVHLGTW